MILTENNNNLITENSNTLVTEDSQTIISTSYIVYLNSNRVLDKNMAFSYFPNFGIHIDVVNEATGTVQVKEPRVNRDIYPRRGG